MWTNARRWALRATALAIASGVVVAACRNDVPGPTLPIPAAPEVSPIGPKPKPIEPAPRKAKPKRVGHAPIDAGVDDVLDLPPVTDADVPIVADAAQPLR